MTDCVPIPSMITGVIGTDEVTQDVFVGKGDT